MILEQLADRVSAAIWNLHPGWAVAAGRHEYDGQVPDLSAESIAAGLERLGRLREQLAGLAGLSPEQEVDRAVLLGAIDRERFEGEAAQRWRRDPAWYLGPLDISVYLERDYAPVGLRLERAATVLGEAGRLLETARGNLGLPLPRRWAEPAVGRARHLAAHLVAQAEWAPGGRSAPGEAAGLREAAGLAARELQSLAAWLETERLPGVTEDGPWGREGLDRWLRAAEGPGGGLDRGAMPEARLAEDREALAADAARLAPGLSPGEACRRAAADGAEADPVAAGRHAVEQARRSVAGLGLVDGGEAPSVAAAPGEAGEGVAGWLQAPGPYDDAATRPVLYVVPGCGRAALEALAVTEVCPGSLVVRRHVAGAPGEARRRFPSRGFLDGWSLYAGDLMAAAGFGEEAAGWRLLWRQRVVVAGCHLAYTARLHSGEVSGERVRQAFEEEAGLSPEAAHAEARRGAADPGLVLGALGRIAILEARRRWGAPRPLRAFHEALLSGAALPLGLLDRLLAS